MRQTTPAVATQGIAGPVVVADGSQQLSESGSLFGRWPISRPTVGVTSNGASNTTGVVMAKADVQTATDVMTILGAQCAHGRRADPGRQRRCERDRRAGQADAGRRARRSGAPDRARAAIRPAATRWSCWWSAAARARRQASTMRRSSRRRQFPERRRAPCAGLRDRDRAADRATWPGCRPLPRRPAGNTSKFPSGRSTPPCARRSSWRRPAPRRRPARSSCPKRSRR